jgi:hypothetical protein
MVTNMFDLTGLCACAAVCVGWGGNVQIRVSVGHVGVCVMTDDMLVVPHKW